MLDGSVPRPVVAGMANCASVLPLADEIVMTVGGLADIQLNDLHTGRRAQVASLSLHSSVFEFASGPNNLIYLASYLGSRSGNFAAIELDIGPPVGDFIQRAFARADTGDLAGYAREVERIANRRVRSCGMTGAQLVELYNDALGQAQRQLYESIDEMMTGHGLHLTSPPTSRPLEGWPPPEYGGSATMPRWQFPDGSNGPWLEASIGVSHRAWPAEDLNDLIITSIFARMSENGQHTFLTRFVPFEVGEAELGTKLQELLSVLRAVLPEGINSLKHSD